MTKQTNAGEPACPVARDGAGARASLDYNPNTTEHIADPCPFLRTARERTPVFFSPHHGGFWTLTGYDDIWEASHDQSRFTSAVVGVTTLQKVYDRTDPYIPIEIDDPDHAEFRNIVAPLLARSAVLRLEPRVRAIVGELLDALPTGRPADLVQDFTLPAVSRVLMLAMGMPVQDAPVLVGLAMDMFHGRINDRPRAERGASGLNAYINKVISDRIAHPLDDDDLLTRLVTARVQGGRPLTKTEMRLYAANIFLAGFETTINGIGTSLWYLTQNDELRRHLLGNPARIPRAVEELLRFFSPVQLFGRNATRDLEFHGQRIDEGEAVFLHYGSGNRDESAFEDPDRFDPERWPNRHLAFGSGIHFCMGAHIARLEMAVALSEVLRRFPDYRLATADGAEPEWTPSGDTRGLWRLPVILIPPAAPAEED